MFFQDGEAHVDGEGSVRAPVVFDNLIHNREMPKCIGVFVNPASVDELFDQRATEYKPLTDTYTRFDGSGATFQASELNAQVRHSNW